MAIIGWYYLHENNELIYKPSSDAITDIRDSSFAVCSWPMDPESRLMGWNILVESFALGAKKSRIEELADKWSCDNDDAETYASHIGVNLSVDGNQFCATKIDFVNLQESPAGFGATKLEAMSELAKELGISGGHMWRSTFQDLVEVK